MTKIYKKYILMLPVIFYPYLYVIGIFILFYLPNENWSIVSDLAWIVNIYCFGAAVFNAVAAAKGSMTAKQSAIMNLVIKTVQIPAYIFHFILFVVGGTTAPWGVLLLLWGGVMNVLPMLITGINAIGCSIRMCKEKIFSKRASILMGIGSFVYCIDVIIAVIYVVRTVRKDMQDSLSGF